MFYVPLHYCIIMISLYTRFSLSAAGYTCMTTYRPNHYGFSFKHPKTIDCGIAIFIPILSTLQTNDYTHWLMSGTVTQHFVITFHFQQYQKTVYV